MNRLSQLILLLLAAALLLLPHTAQAHKLSVFAWPEGGEIRGEVKFSGGRKAKNVQIAVQNAADQAVLAETSCDENGAFRFALPEQALTAKPDLLIVANGGEGHRGEWLLAAKEYAPAVPAGAVSTGSTAAAAPSAGVSEQQIRRIVAEEMSKSLSPIRQSVAESLDPEPTLRDILGGVGWLIGLAGMAAWAQSRRSRHS
jgi:nickel transport protein